MADEIIKTSNEIKRLTTPLKFKNSKAYDSEGNVVDCVETLSEIKYVIEPKVGLLSEEDILEYAPKSKAASKIRLNKGVGNLSDVMNIHNSIFWVLGIYYTILICLATAIRGSWLFLILGLIVLPLLYLYYIFNLKNYSVKTKKAIATNNKDKKASETVKTEKVKTDENGVESLKKYENKVNELKVLYDAKEDVVKELIEKRFKPPQITYDKFMATVDNCHKLFYEQVDGALNITQMAVEDTPRIDFELEKKIENMQSLIDQVEELINELVINISSDKHSNEDIKNVLEDMDNLIDSVKEY